jgi:hypothetical protein
MGVYYTWVNKTRNELISPGEVNNGGVKWWATIFGDSAKLVTFAIARHGWDDCQIEMMADIGQDWDDFLEGNPTNITKNLIDDWNDYIKDELDWIPELRHTPYNDE